MHIIPIKFVLRFDPPVFGVIYKRHEKEKSRKIHQIKFKDVDNFLQKSAASIANILIKNHSEYLNSDFISQQ
jgi:hypothetical protein